MSAAAAVSAFGGRAGQAGQLVMGHASTAYGAGGEQVSGKGTGWSIVGYALALILLYVIVADSRVVAASSKLVGGAQTAAEAWVAPVDPVALLGERFGASPASSSTATAAGAPAAATAALSGFTGGFTPLETENQNPLGKTTLAPTPAQAGAGASAQVVGKVGKDKTIQQLIQFGGPKGHLTPSGVKSLLSGKLSIKSAEAQLGL